MRALRRWLDSSVLCAARAHRSCKGRCWDHERLVYMPCACRCHGKASATPSSHGVRAALAAARVDPSTDTYTAQCTGCYRKFENEHGAGTYCPRCLRNALDRERQTREAVQSELEKRETDDFLIALREHDQTLERRVAELEVELARTREALKELVRLKDAEEGKAVLAYSFDAWGNARSVISSPARFIVDPSSSETYGVGWPD